MKTTALSEASVYVGTYGKYNNGSLFGAWLDLSDYADKEEFYEACRELHKDEEDAEFMFQDWENVPEGLIGESWISENFFTLRNAVEQLGDTEQEAFFVWCNCSCAIIGLMTALCSGRLEKDNPGGVSKPCPLKQRN